MSTPAQRRSRGALIGLGLMFFAPLLLSFALYYGSSWRPLGHTNHGTLIEPARPLPAVTLPRVDRADAAIDSSAVLSGKWSLVYVGGGDCDAACRQTLYFIRQTDFGMGNLMPRIQRVFIATAQCCDRAFLAQEHPGLITLDARAAAAAPLLALFPDQRSQSLFIVDPRGNLMMRYDANADPKGLREDLKKLLNLSHIG